MKFDTAFLNVPSGGRIERGTVSIHSCCLAGNAYPVRCNVCQALRRTLRERQCLRSVTILKALSYPVLAHRYANVKLFNFSVLEQGTGTHPRVGSLTLTLNVVLVGLRLVSYLKLEAFRPRLFRAGC